jgi:hypothetical protein
MAVLMNMKMKGLKEMTCMKFLPHLLVTAILFLSIYSAADTHPSGISSRWSREKTHAWYAKQPWLCGFNYIPANAISYTEMWMDYSFDPKRIDTELKIAEEVGFNCCRVVFSYVVWEHDPEGFNARFERFLTICHKRGLKVIPIFFDDCVFGPITDPVYGRQPEIVEGWYANGWTPNPGHSMVRNPASWNQLEKYVTDIMNRHKNDLRILCWDLYNEPTNAGLGDASIPLLEKVFEWARRVNPVQPLTTGWWNNNPKLNKVIFENSDIITFHNYLSADRLYKQIRELQMLGRPVICTEWLNRGLQSVVITCLPIFYHTNVGCMHWGLVNGRTQTDLNWGHRPGDPEPALWQHDIYRPDYKPYSSEEIDIFKFYLRTAKSLKRSRLLWADPVLPTSELLAQRWKYTFQDPGEKWADPDYNDSQWKTGEGGFGTAGTAGLAVGSIWQTGQIWLRKEFQLEDASVSDLCFRIFHDEDIWIYVNGEPVIYRAGWTTDYIVVPVPADKLRLFKTGRNIIAVTCKQTSGGQGVDVGIMNIKKNR